MNIRTIKRSMKKANQEPMRRGPAKGSTGKAKGPNQLPSLAAMRAAKRGT